MPVRDRIWQIMKSRGMTQQAVVDRMDEKYAWVNTRMNGVVQIKADELPKFAAALGVSTAVLLGEIESMSDQDRDRADTFAHTFSKDWADWPEGDREFFSRLADRVAGLITDEFRRYREESANDR